MQTTSSYLKIVILGYPLLFHAGCRVTTENPLENNPVFDVTPLLGTWTIASVAGETLTTSCSVTISGVATQLNIVTFDSSSTINEIGHVTDSGGQLIVSIKGETELWRIGKLEFGETINTLFYYDMDYEQIISAITNGITTGQVSYVDAYTTSVHLFGTSSSLTYFVQSNPNIFLTNGIRLTRP